MAGKSGPKSAVYNVIIISGTPGVGKSTVSCLLASRINAKLISVGELVKKERLYSGTDRERDTLVADMNKLAQRIKQIVGESHGQTIIEGHYATELVPSEKVVLIFVLRRDPIELKTILEERKYKKGKVHENLAAEILDVCLYDAIKYHGMDKVCEIDITGKTVEDVVDEILMVLSAKKKCKVGTVDWLGKLEFEGKLDEYLQYF